MIWIVNSNWWEVPKLGRGGRRVSSELRNRNNCFKKERKEKLYFYLIILFFLLNLKGNHLFFLLPPNIFFASLFIRFLLHLVHPKLLLIFGFQFSVLLKYFFSFFFIIMYNVSIGRLLCSWKYALSCSLIIIIILGYYSCYY